MSKKPKDNSVGAWAKDKLESLRRGLDYYTTRFKNQPHWQQVYIDAFAGPGLSTIRTKPREQGGERGARYHRRAARASPARHFCSPPRARRRSRA